MNPLVPQTVEIHRELAQALRDPMLERARQLQIVEDFKILADLSPRILTQNEKSEISKQAQEIADREGERAALQFQIEALYEGRNELNPVSIPEVKPHWTVNSDDHRSAFEHTERMWSELIRQTPQRTKSSLIPLPFPILIPGARFQEGYYWDTFFAFPALLQTGRKRLVQGQIENFLFLLENYGLIPNGTRDYYLTRSQPPLISQMIRLYLEAEMKQGPLSLENSKWLRDRVYPLLQNDYESFWMNPETRLDSKCGLNHHFDSEDTDRPERHSSDREDQLAFTKRDVRAEAESGKDFTDAFEGQASQVAGVLLNSLLYQYEKNLSWWAQQLGRDQDFPKYERAAQKRKTLIDRSLWDDSSKTYRDFNFKTEKRSSVITADIFVPLAVGLASEEQAQAIRACLPMLEREGGLMSSDRNSGKQWDAPYGWAPHHYFVIEGLRKYGYLEDAHRLAGKWIRSVEKIYRETGHMLEKIDAIDGTLPQEMGDKYPTQEGFLWTNGVYVWALLDVLEFRLVKKESVLKSQDPLP